MDTIFYKMDLHIHTPASKCYLGPKNDEEYFEILRVAHKQNLDIIAITDHNTVDGYEHLYALKKELENKKNILSEFQDSATQIKDALSECEEKLLLFKDIMIIPGVEITLNPGIHMLVLSTPDKLDDLSALLNSIGYTKDKRGSDCDTEISVDIKNFLSSSLLNDFLIIAPHIDSNKGIYNSLDGQFRADIMRSESIHAFSCNALSQKEKIIHLFSHEPTYKRTYSPAFVNCSDSHNSIDVGKKFSYIKLQSLSLSEIKSVFLAPEGQISDTNDQRLEKTIRELIDKETPILISNSELINTTDLSHYICAGLNEGIYYILLGVTPKGNLVGLKNEVLNLKELVHDAIDLVDSNYPQLRYTVKTEALGNGNNIVIIHLIPGINCLWHIEKSEHVYILNDNIPTIASIMEVESLVYTNTLSEITMLEKNNNHTAEKIGAQLLSLTNAASKYDILQRIMLYSVPLTGLINICAHSSTNLTEEVFNKYFYSNGEPNGNIYYVCKNAARLNDAILRLSCPTANVPCDILETLDFVPVLPYNIIISQYGGSHIVTSDKNIVGIKSNYLILTPKEEENKFSYLLIAWLKSSLFIWFTYKKYNTTNIYIPEIMHDLVIPCTVLEDLFSEITNIVQDIIRQEDKFIEQIVKDESFINYQAGDGEDDVYVEKINRHNEIIAQKITILDQLIFDAFDIDDNEQQLIKEDLEAAGIYNII